MNCLNSIRVLSFYEFIQDSKNLGDKNLSLHKETLKREVSRAEELIKYERSKLDSLIRKKIKDRVYEAHTIATDLYNKYKKEGYSRLLYAMEMG